MANWAWPHTPNSSFARLLLAGGPFDGEEVAFLPPDCSAPAQIVWSGWGREGFTAWLYEWHGERADDPGRATALVYRATGRRVGPKEIPPQLTEDVLVWADGAVMIASVFDVHPELIWPGL